MFCFADESQVHRSQQGWTEGKYIINREKDLAY